MSPASPDVFVAFASRLADAAGAAIRPHFRNLKAVERKADSSPVTVADRAAEKAMRDLIEAAFPDHGIHGEEYGVVRPDADHVWILDPIDGTKSFVTGLPIWGTLIALAHKGEAILGVIDQPVLNERWLGARGRPTTFNGKPVRVRDCPRLEEAALFTTTMDLLNPSELAAFEKLRRRVRVNRLAGDCYAYGLLAAGFADLVVECRVQPYDFAALIPVIEGAGGRITDWEGRALSLKSPSRLLAAGDHEMHGAAVQLLAGA